MSATTDTPVLNHVDVKNASVNAKKEVTNGAPPYAKSLMSNSKVALIGVPLLFVGWDLSLLCQILLYCFVKMFIPFLFARSSYDNLVDVTKKKSVIC